MPCDTIQLNTIDLPKMQPTLRGRALAEMGIQQASPHLTQFNRGGHWYFIRGGELQSSTATPEQVAETANLLKRHYSAQVVKYTAQRQGWKVRKVAEFQYEVIK